MNAKTYLETHWIKNRIWTHLQTERHQERLRRCVSYFGEAAGMFLDVGCALGHSTNIMRGFRPGVWAGLEFFDAAAVEARKLFPDLTFYSARDFDVWPVCGTYDGVVCSEVIEHVEDDAALVKGLLGVTRHTLVITTPNVRVKDPGHLRVYTADKLRALFTGLDCTVESADPFFYAVVRR